MGSFIVFLMPYVSSCQVVIRRNGGDTPFPHTQRLKKPKLEKFYGSSKLLAVSAFFVILAPQLANLRNVRQEGG